MTSSDGALPGAPAAGERPIVHCEGPCGGRLLTDPLSRSLRLGPECRVPVFGERGFEVEQEMLPGFEMSP